MQTTKSHGIDWWNGNNGNLFGDYNGYRYCIVRLTNGEYTVARDGIEIARLSCLADAKLFVKREG